MLLKLLAIALLSCQTSGGPADQKSKNDDPQPKARPAAEITIEMNALLKKEAKAKDFAEREPLIKGLAKVYGDIRLAMRSGSAATLTKDEYRLRMRMVGIVKELNRRVAKASEESIKRDAKLLKNPEAYSKSAFEESTLHGGGTIADATNLIQIIITTIDPDGWQANGGTYVIEYWAQGMALVVAAPADVHEAIGGSLGGLRK